MADDRNLSLAGLRTFVAVVDRGGFTPAAEILGLTQPTVSQQIKKLEEQLGESLIERGTRLLKLTETGSGVLDYARKIVDLNDQAIASVARPQIVGSLRLGLPHEFTFTLLPRLVGSFSQIHPGVVVEVECQLSKTLLSRPDDFDIVLALHRAEDGEAGRLLRKEPLRWVCSPDYETEDRAPLLVAAAPSPCIYREVLQERLREYEPGWSLYLASASYGAICGAVSSGRGIALLAESVIPDGLVVTSIPGIGQLETLELRMHKANPSDPSVVATFESFVIDRVAERG